MVNIAVFISGGGTDLQSIIDAIEAKTIAGKITYVVSNRQKAYGLIRAQKAGIETEVVKNDDRYLISRLKEKNIGLIVLAGYLAIVSNELIAEYPNKIINIHPSLIPAFCGPGYYGLYVHEAVLDRGVKVSGATVHFVSSVVDGGPIIIQEACDISDIADPQELQARVLAIEHRILPEAVRKFCQGKILVENGKAKVIK